MQAFDPNQALPPGNPLRRRVGRVFPTNMPVRTRSPTTKPAAISSATRVRAVFVDPPHAPEPRIPAQLYAGEVRLTTLPGGLALNPYDLRAERAASSSNDRRDVVQFQFTAESPVDQRNGFLANKGILTKVLKNWTLQAPITWETGAPLTATAGRRRHRWHRRQYQWSTSRSNRPTD